MLHITNRYQKLEKLGEGTYGIVYKAQDQETLSFVAIKQTKILQEEEGVPSTTLREVSVLKTISHPNVVKLLDVSLSQSNLTLIFEYMDYDLRYFLNHTKRIVAPNLLQSYSYQLLCGLYELHAHRIIHRDLKPENILLSKNGYLKIADFGWARYVSVPTRNYSPSPGSITYQAPEILLGSPFYDLSIDIWSCACILAEMVLPEPIFRGDSDLDQLHKIFGILGTPTPETFPLVTSFRPEFQFPEKHPINLNEVLNTADEYFIDLISKMLQLDPLKRIPVQEAIIHPYFDSISREIKEMSCPKEIYKHKG